MNFPKQTKSGSDCQCSKSTAYSNRGAKRTNTVRPHLLDCNHISVRTTPASLSLGIIFTSLITYFYCYVNWRIYSNNMLFLLLIQSLHLQECVKTLTIDIPDLHLNLIESQLLPNKLKCTRMSKVIL
jgi:hypothetical protein